MRLIHNTSRAYRLFRGGLLDVTAELISHGGEQFIREVCLSTEGNPHARLVEEASDPTPPNTQKQLRRALTIAVLAGSWVPWYVDPTVPAPRMVWEDGPGLT